MPDNCGGFPDCHLADQLVLGAANRRGCHSSPNSWDVRVPNRLRHDIADRHLPTTGGVDHDGVIVLVSRSTSAALPFILPGCGLAAGTPSLVGVTGPMIRPGDRARSGGAVGVLFALRAFAIAVRRTTHSTLGVDSRGRSW